MKKKKFTKIRENITEVEYQKLLTYLNGKEDLTTNTKNNLRRTFILLYFTGMRVNEVKQSAKTNRPSASVFVTSIVFPFATFKTSPGL